MPHDTHPNRSDTGRAPVSLTALAAMLVAGLAAATIAAIPNPGFAQEARPMATRGHAATTDADRAALAAFGIDLAGIDDCHDVALLWRAVRELVLPGRVSEATRRRILRRVWSADPDFSQSGYVDSPTN